MTEEEMLQLLDAADEATRAAWAEILRYLRETNQLSDVMAALEQGRYEDTVRGIEEAGRRLAQEWARQFTEAALAAAAAAGSMSGKFVSYDSSNPLAVSAVAQRRLEIVEVVSSDVTELVQSVVQRGLQAGTNPLVMAREIRDSLGLTAAQEQIVHNYETALRTGNFADAMRRELHDGRYDARLRTGRPLTETQVEQMVDRYRQNWIEFRAETISRDVALTALHEGSEEAFRQAFETGQLEQDEIVVTWSSALRPRTRDSHKAMHGQQRPPGVPFTSGNGYLLRYPGDPSAPLKERMGCLCVLTRRMKLSASATQAIY